MNDSSSKLTARLRDQLAEARHEYSILIHLVPTPGPISAASFEAHAAPIISQLIAAGARVTAQLWIVSTIAATASSDVIHELSQSELVREIAVDQQVTALATPPADQE